MIIQYPLTSLPFKSDWEPEIRKRYLQPLASEVGEFPDAETIHNRMVPICYEEALPNGCTSPCAELMAIATETYIKETLSTIVALARSNGPATLNDGIRTHKYKRQLEKEEEGFLRGEVARNSVNGMLPVEAKEAIGRRELGMADLRLAVEIGGGTLGQMPLTIERIMGGYQEGELEEESKHWRDVDGEVDDRPEPDMANGDVMSLDENDWGWEGGGQSDRDQLGALLDDCLAIAA